MTEDPTAVKIYINDLKHDYEKEFIRELRHKMRDHNLTHEQLAHIVGKSRTCITMWLTGRSGLMMTDAMLIADFFGIKVMKKLRPAELEGEPDNAA